MTRDMIEEPSRQSSDLPAPTRAELLDQLREAAQGESQGRFSQGRLPRFIQVHHEYIEPGRWQPRTQFDEAALAELADDIARRGIINPLKVFVNAAARFELIAGERRLRAARQAGLELVPIEVIAGTPDEIQELSLIDNLQRADLSPLEEGAAYQRMFQQLGISEAELARRVGKSRGHIQQRRALATAAPALRDALEAGEITLTLTRPIAMGTDNPKLQKKALTAVKKRIKTGARTDEREVRQIVADLVRKEGIDQLRALGWAVEGDIIWGGAEKPRRWSADEITQVITEQRRPTGDLPAPGEPTQEQHYVLGARYFDYYKDEKFRPWLAFTDRETYAPVFFSCAELPDLVLQIGRAFADLQKQYNQHGWHLTLNGQGGFQASHPDGRQMRLLNWTELETSLANITAGKERTTHGREQTYHWHCEHCRTRHQSPDTRPQRLGHYQVCPACYDVAQQRIAAQRARIRQEHGMLLVRMDADLLRRVLLLGRSDVAVQQFMRSLSTRGIYSEDELGERLAAVDGDQLREVLLDSLAQMAYRLGEPVEEQEAVVNG